jgi:hypothetical protein
MSQENAKNALEQLRRDCYPSINSTNAPSSSGFSPLTDMELFSPCANKNLIRIIVGNKVPPKNASLETASIAVNSTSASTAVASTSSEKSTVKKTENSGTEGLFLGLKGLLKGKDKEEKGKDKEEKDKNKEEKGKEKEEKVVKGLDNLFKDKLNKKWFEEQQKYFLKDKDSKDVVIMQLLDKFLNKKDKDPEIEIEESILKKYLYFYLTSFYSIINDINKKNTIEHIVAYLLDEINPTATKGGSPTKTTPTASTPNAPKPTPTASTPNAPKPSQNASTPKPTPTASTPNAPKPSQNASTPKPTPTASTPNAPKPSQNASTPNAPIKEISSEINENVFDNLFKKFQMHLYTTKELIEFNKGSKSKADKTTPPLPPGDKKGGNKKHGGDGNTISLKDGISRSLHTATSFKAKVKSLTNSVKNLTINESNFWTYIPSEGGKILVIDNKEEINIDKYKDFDSVDIANKIIKYLKGTDESKDAIDKLKPLIDDNLLKDIILKIKNNKVEEKDEVHIFKLILQGIKFMFELSLKPPGPPQKEKHKLKVNGFVDEFVNNSYENLVTPLLPLFKKGENEKINHIKMDEEELKKAFECLVTEILTPSKTFPLKDKSKIEKEKDTKYIVYDISKNSIASTLKATCDIIIPDPKMDEKKFQEEITKYPIPQNIYSKEQEADKDTNLIHKMIEKMKVLAATPKGNTTVPPPSNAIDPTKGNVKAQNSSNANDPTKGNAKAPKSSNANVPPKENAKAPKSSNANGPPKENVKAPKSSNVNGPPKENVKVPNAPVSASKGGKNIINKNKEYTFILGRKRILNKIGRSYYVKYNNVNIKLTEAKLIEKKILKTKILSKKSKKIHHLI